MRSARGLINVRTEQFYVGLDSIFPGRTSDNIEADGSMFRGTKAARQLEQLTAAALETVGRGATGIRLDPDFEARGSTSVVRAVDARDSRYAMRLQPSGEDGYSHVERLTRSISAALGLKTPQIYAAHTDLPPEMRPDFTFTLEEFLPGEQVSTYRWKYPERNILPPILQKAGAALAVMHAYTVDNGYGFFDVLAAKQGVLRGQHGSYRDHVTAGLRPALSAIREGNVLSQTQTEQLDEYFRHAELIGQLGADKAKLLHGELTLYNMRFGGDTGDPYIIDFGETRAGPAIHDLAAVHAYLARNDLGNAMDNVLEGYTAQGGTLPGRFDESLRAIRLRHFVSIVAGQLIFSRNNPDNTTVAPFLEPTIAALQKDATSIGV